MRVVCISDTHSRHLGLYNPPKGDLIIHAGDVSNIGRKGEITDFLNWFSKLPYKYRIFIAGNHDFFFDHKWKAYTEMGEARFKGNYAGLYTKEEVDSMVNTFKDDVTYLNDSGIEIEGFKIWGSPITPWFHDWAFNRERGKDIKKHWKLIPEDTDILITHGPVHKILDRTREGDEPGCEDLLEKILKTSIKVSICGHIHESGGHTYSTGDGRIFINVSLLNRDYNVANKPVVFDITKDDKGETKVELVFLTYNDDGSSSNKEAPEPPPGVFFKNKPSKKNEEEK